MIVLIVKNIYREFKILYIIIVYYFKGGEILSSIKTRTRYVIVGGDYSQQEPRLLTHMCGDDKLKETYNNKKDLYATIGAFVFHKDYWECMEHWQDGSPNDSGKVLRARCKQLVLGRP